MPKWSNFNLCARRLYKERFVAQSTFEKKRREGTSKNILLLSFVLIELQTQHNTQAQTTTVANR
jgi:hypothetical protein